MQNHKAVFLKQFIQSLRNLGVRPGGVLLVHSSLKSLGQVPGGAETVIQGLLDCLGENGTLLMPALTYESVTPGYPVFDLNATQSCVGAIPEHFRIRNGTQRSLHPTHSVCAHGPKAEDLLHRHAKDSTPCGPNSPFHRLPEVNGQILMLGCGLQPNTSMHAIEELVIPAYLFGAPITYKLVDGDGRAYSKQYTPHNFKNWEQHYERIKPLLPPPHLETSNVVKAKSHLIEARRLWDTVLKILRENPAYFVEEILI